MSCMDYYGRMEPVKVTVNNVVDYILKENDSMVLNALNEMEERIKVYMFEVKRNIMKEVKKNGCQCKSKEIDKDGTEEDGIRFDHYTKYISL